MKLSPHLSRFWLQADEQNSTLSVDTLTVLALAYIAIPNFCFLLGWLKPQYGISGSLLLLTSLWQFSSKATWRTEYSRFAILTIITAGVVWCIFGGAGHFTYANPDWTVRDAVYADLIYTPWPPAYGEADGAPLIMRSAIGYFLPPAALTQALGIKAANWILFTWTALGTGLFLLLLPLPRRGGMRLGAALLLVIFFSGMDFLGIVLGTGDLPIFPLRLEWWVPFSYSSLSGQLFWAPNHTIPIWITTALLYRHWATPQLPTIMAVLLPMLCIWTPFALLAVIPFATLWLLLNANQRTWQKINAIHWIAGALLTLVVVRLMTVGVDAIPALPSKQNSPVHLHDTTRYVSDYALFVLMEFGLLALVLWKQGPPIRALFIVSVAILLLLPLYQFGPSNDSMLRLSVPPLLILMLATLSVCDRWMNTRISPPWGKTLLVFLIFGAQTPFNEIWRAATFRHNTPPNYNVTFVESQHGGKPAHYIGKLVQADLIEFLRTPTQVQPRR